MLNLWNLKQVSVRDADGEYHIVANAVTPTPFCCGATLRNGTKAVEFVDTPMHGKRVTIEVRMQRYKCKGCGATLYPEIPHMHERHRMTQRCFEYICENGTKRSWSALGAEIGIDAQTVSDIWNTWADGVLDKLRPTTPEWLGIDELFIMRKYRAVITDVRNRALVTMLPSRDMGTLHAYFTERIEGDKVQVVTMDMWTPYRDTVRACFPKAKIVVDRFHVMKYASEAVENVRKTVRRQLDKQRRVSLLGDRWLFLTGRNNLSALQTIKLEAVLEQYPTIKEAYVLKEAFRDVWQTSDRQEAEARYADWLQRVAKSQSADAFKAMTRAVSNWHEEIFAYMDWRLTNAYTESFNALARRMDRVGNGYSFEALKKRLIMAHSLSVINPPVEGRVTGLPPDFSTLIGVL